MTEAERDRVRALVSEIEGWLLDEEGELLYDLAKNCQGRGVIVEVGSWKGKSTIWLAMGSRMGPKTKIYAVDTFAGDVEDQKRNEGSTLECFKNNLSLTGVEDMVIPVIKPSKEAAQQFDQPVEMLFIDGSHSGDSPKTDFVLWFPKLIDGGIVAFHDSLMYKAVEETVNKYIYKSRDFREVGLVGSTTFARKVKENSLKDRLVNRYVLFIKNIYRIGYESYLPKPIKITGKMLVRLFSLSSIRIP